MSDTPAPPPAVWLVRLLPGAAALLGLVGVVLASRPEAMWASGGLVAVAIVVIANGPGGLSRERCRSVLLATGAGALAAFVFIGAMGASETPSADPRVAQR